MESELRRVALAQENHFNKVVFGSVSRLGAHIVRQAQTNSLTRNLLVQCKYINAIFYFKNVCSVTKITIIYPFMGLYMCYTWGKN